MLCAPNKAPSVEVDAFELLMLSGHDAMATVTVSDRHNTE